MKADGESRETDLETGKVVTTATCQCCHCGRHWEYKPGSGRKRGWCRNCHAITCGNTECDPCVHFLQKLENQVKGLPVEHKPVIVQGVDIGRLETR